MREEALKKARELIESEKFEEAISELESLEVNQDNSREVRELKEQAIEGLINRERNRAAKIFLAAKNTSDPRKKEEYLKSCYDILNNLLEKYPSSPLREKLKSHIKKVSEELDRLGRN
jgi:outer membrane protein assembly factor BamD (BamD/ComL family)